MIIISNKPLDVTAMMNEYPADSVESLLLKKMNDSTHKYRYDSLDQLKFELRLRKEIVNAAKELHKSKFNFAVFPKSKCNPAYWDRTDNGGFKLKDGVKPSDAINDIFINGDKYATECATAMIVVYYKALLNIFAEDLFNKTFPKIYMMNWHSIDLLLREVGTPTKVPDILLGDRGYFANPDVDPKTPEWQGENVIVLPDGLYYGHGVGVHKAETIIMELNNNRKKDATQSAHFLDSASRPDFKNLANIYYRSLERPVSLDWSHFSTAV